MLSSVVRSRYPFAHTILDGYNIGHDCATRIGASSNRTDPRPALIHIHTVALLAFHNHRLDPVVLDHKALLSRIYVHGQLEFTPIQQGRHMSGAATHYVVNHAAGS